VKQPYMAELRKQFCLACSRGLSRKREPDSAAPPAVRSRACDNEVSEPNGLGRSSLASDCERRCAARALARVVPLTCDASVGRAPGGVLERG
jgi:hypothetical protein